MTATTASALSLCPDDLGLLASLGLDPGDRGRDFRSLGEVTVGRSVIRVEVAVVPAAFWRFSIVRDGGVYIIETGSGSFGEYWPMVKLIAVKVLRRTPYLTVEAAARFTAAVEEARAWCQDCGWEELDAETQIVEADAYTLVRAVQRTYDGGWASFVRDAAA